MQLGGLHRPVSTVAMLIHHTLQLRLVYSASVKRGVRLRHLHLCRSPPRSISGITSNAALNCSGCPSTSIRFVSCGCETGRRFCSFNRLSEALRDQALQHLLANLLGKPVLDHRESGTLPDAEARNPRELLVLLHHAAERLRDLSPHPHFTSRSHASAPGSASAAAMRMLVSGMLVSGMIVLVNHAPWHFMARGLLFRCIHRWRAASQPSFSVSGHQSGVKVMPS